MGAVPRPPHQDDRVEAGFGDRGGYFPDSASAKAYASKAVQSDYGRDRVRAVKALVEGVSLAGANVVDFGGGDGSFVAELGIDFARLVLIDVSPDMLGLAEDFIEHEKLTTLCGSEEMMGELANESIDLILCINAINYLETESQERFFAEAHRVLRSGGHLLVMTGNELLDLFSLNSGTAEFFEKNFGSDVAPLLVSGSEERWVNAGRFNPLSFGAVVAKYGFRELKQAYSQWHEVPPGLAALNAKGDLPAARLAARNHALNPNELPNESGWQALFRCSMFASLCRKA